MVLAIYRYLNIILEMLIPKIYWFMDVTCKQKALREDKRTTEVTTLYIYILAKNLPYGQVFGLPLMGCDLKNICFQDICCKLLKQK